jgi:hypothetical protein
MSLAERMKDRFAPFFAWVQRRVPPGFRFALGLLPLGFMVAAMDVRLYRRWRSLRRRRRAMRP